MTTYYHGGAPDLTVILPPSITGVSSLADYVLRTAQSEGNVFCRRDRVYVTTSYEASLLYAVGHPSDEGVAYVVDPVYPLEEDPDCDTPGLSYACRKARVLSVILISDLTRMAIKAVLA